MRPIERCRRGLTLLELTMAVTLLSFVLLPFFAGFRAGDMAVEQSQLELELVARARGMLADLAAAGYEQAASARGTLAPERPGVCYELRVETIAPSLKSVGLRLSWLHRGSEREPTFATRIASRRMLKR